MPNFPGRDEKTIPVMYGKEDLSQFPVFQGGFINFGYWENIPEKSTKEDRILASKQLYEEVFGRLSITPGDIVLEVGCGRGFGCLMTLEKYRVKEIYGLDATPEQIERCKKEHEKHLKNGRLHFIHGLASKTTFSSGKFSKVYSVEAAQHFPSLPVFFNEAFRVLQVGGKLAFTTFFRQKGASLEEIGRLLPTVEKKIDYFHPIDECLVQLKESGFSNIKHQNIGKYVWRGFDNWQAVVAPNDWGRNWLKVYQNNLIDYYIIEVYKRA